MLRNNIIKAFLFLSLAFLISITYAQGLKNEALPISKNVTLDQSTVHIREFNESKLNSYRNDPAYRYGENAPIKNNLLSQFIEWLLKKLLRPLSNPRTYTITEYVLISICSIIVIYAILKLTKSDWLNVFSKGSKKVINPGFEELDENIHELDFDKLINQALNEQNFTRVVRLSYLKVLKSLSDKQLIDWRINKTNHDYLYELSKSALEPEFRRLTFIFEYICYGNFPIKQNEFQSIDDNFKSFQQKIK